MTSAISGDRDDGVTKNVGDSSAATMTKTATTTTTTTTTTTSDSGTAGQQQETEHEQVQLEMAAVRARDEITKRALETFLTTSGSCNCSSVKPKLEVKTAKNDPLESSTVCSEPPVSSISKSMQSSCSMLSTSPEQHDEDEENAYDSYTYELPADAPIPKIAFCASGGGMRAMVSMVGFMDGLSQIGLLDCITYVVALSGSVWCPLQWFACPGIGQGWNPFHSTKTSDPWKAGGCFSEEEHNYSLLEEMVVNGREKRDTIAASFLEAVMPESLGVKGGAFDLLAALLHKDASVVKEYTSFLAKRLVSHCCKTNATSVTFSDCAPKLSSGDYPIPIITAITSDSGVNYTGALPEWAWIDITPFTIRKDGKFIKPTQELQFNTVPQLMATCAAAFACDWDYVLPTVQGALPNIVQRLVLPTDAWCDQRQPAAEFIFKETAGYDSDIGHMRDAGIDVNVPFNALRGRHVDIAIVMESSKSARGCECLVAAVKKGYVSVCKQDEPLLTAPFGQNQCFRVFHPEKPGDPLIIYVRGHTLISSVYLDFTSDEMHGIVDSVRRMVVQEAENFRWVIRNWVGRAASTKILHSVAQVVSPPIHNKLKEFFRGKYSRLSLLGTHETVHGRDTCVSLNDLWEIAFRNGKRRCIIEASAGFGKSTLAKYLARNQGEKGWSKHFGVVITLELQHIDPSHPPQTQHEALHDVVGITDPELLEYIEKDMCSDEILWIFDSFDEVERVPAHLPLRKWLDKLIQGNLGWASSTLIMSRKERDAVFDDALHTDLEEWGDEDVERYINKFFKDKPEADRVNTLALLRVNPSIRAFARTPLVCELLCTVQHMLTEPNLTLKMLLDTLVTWLWDRANDKRLKAGLASFTKQQIEEVSSRLMQFALDSYRGSGNIFELDVNDPMESTIYNSGIVRQFANPREVNRAPCKKKCEFIHRMLLEYYTARAVWINMQSHRQLIQGLVHLNPDERLMFVILAGFAKEGNWNELFSEVLSMLSDKLSQRLVEFERQMQHEGKWYSTREKWRNNLGVNIVIEMATIIGDTATEKFICSLSPMAAKLGSVIEYIPLVSRWVAKPSTRYAFAPWIFRILVEPAARYGNIYLLSHLISRAGGHTELDQGLLEAYLSRQHAVIELLVSQGAGRLSAEIPARLGHVEGTKKMLIEADYKDSVMTKVMIAALSRDQVHVIELLVMHMDLTVLLMHALVYRAKSCIQSLSSRITKINLSNSTRTFPSDMVMVMLRACPNMVSLNLSNCNVTEYCILQIAANCPRLTSLQLAWCINTTDACVTSICQHCTNLNVLNLSYCQRVSDHSTLRIPRSLPNLCVLDISGCIRVTDKTLLKIGQSYSHTGQVAGPPSILSCIDLSGLPLITDEGVSVLALGAAAKLAAVGLANCARLTEASVVALADKCGASLTSLNLDGSAAAATDRALQHVASWCTALQHLYASSCERLSDDGVLALARSPACAPRLESLHLADCPGVTEKSVAALAHSCAALADLDVCGCQGLTDEGASRLSSAPLRALTLRWCTLVTDVTLGCLSAARPAETLQSLDLSYCVRVSDRGVAFVAAGCPRLARLKLKACHRVTDAGLAALARGACAGSLSRLCLGGCPSVTDAGVADLLSLCFKQFRSTPAESSTPLSESSQVVTEHSQQTPTPAASSTAVALSGSTTLATSASPQMEPASDAAAVQQLGSSSSLSSSLVASSSSALRATTQEWYPYNPDAVSYKDKNRPVLDLRQCVGVTKSLLSRTAETHPGVRVKL
ncbi:leucine Rich Repeat family protein [Pelomyxa schiedti]|nr:leucine Rich Repeat family protein [Pelomyxa schiedti]